MLMNSKKFLMLIASMLLIIMMFFVTGCNENGGTAGGAASGTRAPAATLTPGDDYEFEITGPDTFKVGEKVEYVAKVTKCNFAEGLIGIDFTFKYNDKMLKFETHEVTKVPADTWDVVMNVKNDPVIELHSYDDNDDMNNLKAVTGPDQFEVKLIFTVLEETSDVKELITVYDVMGAKNNDNIDSATGKSNSIVLK